MRMSRIYRPILLLATITTLAIAGCTSNGGDQGGGSTTSPNPSVSVATDTFATDYARLNGQTNSSGKTYLDVTLPADHRFAISSGEQIKQLFTDGNGVIYFGFPECPWCRNALLPMNEAANQVNLGKIHYVDVLDIRDKKTLNESGQIVVENEGTEFYQFLLDELGEFAPEYPELSDPTVRRILVPLVVVIVDGEVVSSHLGTVDSQEDPYVPLTNEQFDELVAAYAFKFSTLPECEATATAC